jgi:hypothetical protein
MWHSYYLLYHLLNKQLDITREKSTSRLSNLLVNPWPPISGGPQVGLAISVPPLQFCMGIPPLQ